jgi:hypothetical protein
MNDQAIEQEIIAKGKTAPRVKPTDIEANIASEHYFTARDGAMGMHPSLDSLKECPLALGLLTFCVLVLQNGFTVTGESACASPENFDADIGRKAARANAVQKMWSLMGYALKQQLYEKARAPWGCPDCLQSFPNGIPRTCPNKAPGCDELLAQGK